MFFRIFTSSVFVFLSFFANLTAFAESLDQASSAGTAIKLSASTMEALQQPNLSVAAINWLTFLGGEDASDFGRAVTTDASDNIYVAGWSSSNWGSPVGTSSSDGGILVAKLDSSGTLIWHTFLVSGSSGGAAYGIALNGSGDVWITGASIRTWGSNPVHAHTASTDGVDENSDIFVAKLNSSGELQWHTFHGHAPGIGSTFGVDQGNSLVVDSSGNSYVTGLSQGPWSGPTKDGFGGTNTSNMVLLKLDSAGDLQWNAFYGHLGATGQSIALYNNAILYITGGSLTTWGNPLSPMVLGGEATVVRVTTDGVLQWNTFLGSASDGHSIAVDATGAQYIAGRALRAYVGETIRDYSGAGEDLFVAKLNTQGFKVWHTFLGGSGIDREAGIAVSNQSVYVSGISDTSWGAPLNAHTPFVADDDPTTEFRINSDVMVAELNLEGALRHHTFLGSTAEERSFGTAAINSNNDLVIAGMSTLAWSETAINDHAGGNPPEDIFVRIIDFPLVSDILVFGKNTRIENGDVTPELGDDTEFGDIYAAGDPSISRTFTIKNIGTSALQLNGLPLVLITGTNPSDFAVSSPPTTPIMPLGDTMFEVTFNPTAEGVRTATKSIESNDSSESPFLFDVQGTGNPPSPQIEILGGSSGTGFIDNGNIFFNAINGTSFGPLYWGLDGSITNTFHIKNVGTADLILSAVPKIAISGADAADFTVTLIPASTVASLDSTSFEIKYELSSAAESIERRKTTVTVANNDADDNPFTFDIGGEANASYAVGGTLTGLASGNSIVLQNTYDRNLQHELTLVSNGDFVFDSRYAAFSRYSVIILTLPDSPAQDCSLINGVGFLNTGADVTNIEVSCIPLGFSVGGTVTGLEGEGLVLQINGGDNLAVTADGDFMFGVGLDDGAAYDVTLFSLPIEPEQDCSLSNSSGTIATSNIENVGLVCVTPDLIFGGCSGSNEELDSPWCKP